MKLVTFVQDEKRESVGVLLEDSASIADLSPDFTDMLSLIDAGGEALEFARNIQADERRHIALSSVRLRAPLPVPRQIRDCMLFEKHLRQAAATFVRIASVEVTDSS